LGRVALQGLGAVLGGTQSLYANSFDEAIALPSQKAARLALRTQTGHRLRDGRDQDRRLLRGSYVMESMTDDMEAAVVALMQAVEDRGSAVAAIEEGFQKAEIEWSAYRVAVGSTRANAPSSGSTGTPRPRSFIPRVLSVVAAACRQLVFILPSGCDAGPSVVSGGRRFQV
jgi:hypothetical protein